MLARFAEAYAMTDDPVKAAEMCGYPPGQSFSSNAHKRLGVAMFKPWWK